MQSFRRGVTEKEIPTLTPVKKEPAQEPQAPVSEEPQAVAASVTAAHAFSDEQLAKAWESFRSKKLAEDVSDGLRMVLARELQRAGDTAVEIVLATDIERKFLQGAEMELVQHLRKELNNDKVTLAARIQQLEQKQRLYTDKEKFNYLAGKQPLLLKLKEKLNLDTEF